MKKPKNNEGNKTCGLWTETQGFELKPVSLVWFKEEKKTNQTDKTDGQDRSGWVITVFVPRSMWAMLTGTIGPISPMFAYLGIWSKIYVVITSSDILVKLYKNYK